MILEQYYIECLSHASYLIGDETTGRAIVVDPRRDIDRLPLRRRKVRVDHRRSDQYPLPRRLRLRTP